MKRNILFTLLFILALVSSLPAQALNYQQLGAFNGTVKRIFRFNGQWWITGDFTMINATTACTTPGWAVWDGITFQPLPASGPDGKNVSAFEEYNGNLIVGGNFGAGFADDAILQYSAQTGSWTALQGTAGTGPALAEIRSLREYDGKLYVGGKFSSLKGGATANNIAVWDGSDWGVLRPNGAMPSGLQGSVPIVHDMEVFTDTLFIGGRFSSANGVAVDKIVQWDGTNFSSTKATAPTQNIVYNGTVLALETVSVGAQLYALGSFNSIEGEPMSNFGRFRVAAPVWAGVTSPDFVWNNNSSIDANTSDMADCGGNLWVVGSFHGALGVDLERVFRYNYMFTETWSTMDPTHKGLDGEPHCIEANVGTVDILLGGEFSTILGHNGGTDIQRSRLISFRCDGTTEIPEPQSGQGWMAFPNPANDRITISGESPAMIVVYDCKGQLVFSSATESATRHSINVLHWSPGIYFYRAGIRDGSVQSGRFCVE